MSNTIIVSAPGPQGPAGTGGAGGVTDGDKGSIVVTNSGTTWTLDTAAVATANIADDAVTFDKIANVTGPTLLGRQAATSGSVEAIGLGSGLTIDGSKNLALSATYAQQSLTLTAGTGLTGGGDLSASRSFAVAFGSTASTACEGNDARLSDARTPTAHSHAWSDITSGVPATFAPSAHTHALADLTQSGATSGQVIEWNGTAWAPASITGGGGGTVTSVTAGDGLLGGVITASGTIDVNFGNTGNTVCEGNDQRLSDARTPTAHTHGLTDSYIGEIATPAARTYTIDLSAATARTITRLDFKTSAGTVDVTLKNGANNIYTADGLGTTQTTVTTGLSNTSLAANAALTLVVDAVSSPANLSFAVRYTDATGAIS